MARRRQCATATQAETLQELEKQLGLTQIAIASQISCSDRQWRRYRTGEVGLPQDVLEKLLSLVKPSKPDDIRRACGALGQTENGPRESPKHLQAQDPSTKGALPSLWLTPDKLQAAVVNQVTTTKPPNWPLQMQVARSRLGIATKEELLHEWSGPALYDRLLLYCSDNPNDSLAQQALQALLRWNGPLVNSELCFEAAAAGEFPEFQDWVENQVTPAPNWTFPLLSGLWQDLKKALVGVYSADEFRAATPTATIRALRSEGADQLADYWRALARNHQDCDTNSNLWRAVWASDLAEGLIRAHYQEWTPDEKARCEHDWLFAKDGRASVAKACLRVFEAAPV